MLQAIAESAVISNYVSLCPHSARDDECYIASALIEVQIRTDMSASGVKSTFAVANSMTLIAIWIYRTLARLAIRIGRVI